MDSNDYEEDDFLEIPSCVESIVSSCDQLQKLASECVGRHIKLLLSFGCAAEPKFELIADQNTLSLIESLLQDNQDGKRASRHAASLIDQQQATARKLMHEPKVLSSLDCLVRALPLVSSVGLFTSRCFATIEATLKRCVYHLTNSASARLKTPAATGGLGASDGDFQLSESVKLYPLFVGLMDLIYSLESLDRVIREHTSISRNLRLFRKMCKIYLGQLLREQPSESTPTEPLAKLVDYLDKLDFSTYCADGATMFSRLLQHFEHFHLVLAADKTKSGYGLLQRHFEQFILLYSNILIESHEQQANSSHKIPKTDANSIFQRLLLANVTPRVLVHSLPSKLFAFSALVVFYGTLFKPTADKKKVADQYKQMLHKMKPSNVILLEASNSFLLLDEFLFKNQPNLMDSKILAQLKSQVETKVKCDLSKELERFSPRTSKWLVRFRSEAQQYYSQSSMAAQLSSVASLRAKMQLIDQGLRLMREANELIGTTLAAYSVAAKPIARSNVIALFELSAQIEWIRSEMLEGQNSLFLDSCLVDCELFYRSNWRKLLFSLQSEQMSSRVSERRLDLDSMLRLCSICSRVELLASSSGRITLALCVSMLAASCQQRHQLDNFNHLLDLLRLDVRTRARRLSDRSYLYWNVALLPAYYNHAFESNADPRQLQRFLGSLDDIGQLFSLPTELADSQDAQETLEWLRGEQAKFVAKLKLELRCQFESEYVEKICQEFELELRLQTHRDLCGDAQNPFNRRPYNFKQLLQCKRTPRATTFRLLGQLLDVRCSIESQLARVCYQLTAIAPQDWQTYDQMMNLARNKYNLEPVRSQLPAQSRDHGLDLIEIVRNLSLFAARYSYEITGQLFVEKCSASRWSTSLDSGCSLSSYAASSSYGQSLNVFQIQQVVDSIQTHGYGTLESAVNAAYRAIKQLIGLFSRQLTDEKLQTILHRERQQLSLASVQQQQQQQQHHLVQSLGASTRKRRQPNRRGQEQCDPLESGAISYERASAIARKLRLSVSSLDGVRGSKQQQQQPQEPLGVDLDSLRQTITQTGNLIAFIRLLKSGALSCASRAANFVPELKNISNHKTSRLVTTELGANSGPLLEAASNLDDSLSDLERNFSDQTNYLEIIVELFSGLFQSSESKETQLEHLSSFHLLVPALTINHVDSMLSSRERISSRSSTGKFGAQLSDDGFSLGVGFLLAVLGQTKQFAKLDWFATVRQRLEQDKSELERRVGDTRDESLRQTSSITLRRLDRLRDEYRALEFIFNSTKVNRRAGG